MKLIKCNNQIKKFNLTAIFILIIGVFGVNKAFAYDIETDLTNHLIDGAVNADVSGETDGVYYWLKFDNTGKDKVNSYSYRELYRNNLREWNENSSFTATAEADISGFDFDDYMPISILSGIKDISNSTNITETKYYLNGTRIFYKSNDYSKGMEAVFLVPRNLLNSGTNTVEMRQRPQRIQYTNKWFSCEQTFDGNELSGVALTNLLYAHSNQNNPYCHTTNKLEVESDKSDVDYNKLEKGKIYLFSEENFLTPTNGYKNLKTTNYSAAKLNATGIHPWTDDVLGVWFEESEGYIVTILDTWSYKSNAEMLTISAPISDLSQYTTNDEASWATAFYSLSITREDITLYSNQDYNKGTPTANAWTFKYGDVYTSSELSDMGINTSDDLGSLVVTDSSYELCIRFDDANNSYVSIGESNTDITNVSGFKASELISYIFVGDSGCLFSEDY